MTNSDETESTESIFKICAWCGEEFEFFANLFTWHDDYCSDTCVGEANGYDND